MVHNTSSFFSGNGNRTQTTASRSDRREGTGQSRGSFDQDRRETVVVSSLELRQIFESIKLLHNTVKEQSGKLEQLTNDVSFVKAELEKLSSTVDGLRSELPLIKEAVNEQAGSQHYGPVPKAVKDAVHLLHNKQEDNNKFKGQERVDSTHNARVRSFLVTELEKDADLNEFSKQTIFRGVTRYYETKRQQHLDTLPERLEAAEKKNYEKKLTSRRRRLFINRLKVCDENQKERWQKLDPILMSDEEDGTGEHAGTWLVRKPTWRSPELEDLISVLQKKVDERDAKTSFKHPKNKRVIGRPCQRPVPSSNSCPSWAIRERQPAARNDNSSHSSSFSSSSSSPQHSTSTPRASSTPRPVTPNSPSFPRNVSSSADSGNSEERNQNRKRKASKKKRDQQRNRRRIELSDVVLAVQASSQENEDHSDDEMLSTSSSSANSSSSRKRYRRIMSDDEDQFEL